MTQRTLRNWQRLDPAGPVRPPGRPPLAPALREEAARVVEAELERQGWTVGEEPVWRGIERSIPRDRVRQAMRGLKADRRRRKREHQREARVSLQVHARDTLWSMDATHLGRDAGGGEVQAEVVREVASTRTIGISVGPPATGEDIVRLLDDTAAVRRTKPLALLTDNGTYRAGAVAAWCDEHGVLHLFSLPHTPQHNAACEHGMRELKEEALLGKGTPVLDIDLARARLEVARDRVDGARLRRTRGWCTAREADRRTRPWQSLISRETLWAAATCAIRQALLHYPHGRARRIAVREAILGTLQRFSVITRTRGGRPWGVQLAEDVS